MDVRKMLLALGDPTRLAVFDCLRGCGGSSVYDTTTGECDGGQDGAVSICTVKCVVPCKPSTLSHHLNVLREAGLIHTEKRGREVWSKVVPEAVEVLAQYVRHGETAVCEPTPLSIPTEVLTHD